MGDAVNEPKVSWLSVAQLALSAVAVLGLWGIALIIVFVGLLGWLGPANEDPLPLFLLASGLAFSGLLILPSVIYAGLRVMGRPAKQGLRLPGVLRPTLLIFLLPLVLLLGYWLATGTEIAWLGLPLVHVVAIALPVLWLLFITIRRLPWGTPQRVWGVLASGLLLGPTIILFAELVIVLVGIVLLGVWLANQPILEQELLRLMEGMTDPLQAQEEIMKLLSPYLATPGALLASLTFFSVLVPLIEEAFKPVGVWLLAGRGLSPVGGFVAGAISGAGYALFESLALASTGEDWLYVVVARIGTGAVHILNTALVGWALVGAWQERRYLRLGVAYLTAVAIHGLWNGLTVFATFSSLGEVLPGLERMPWLERVADAAPLSLGTMTLMALIVLVLSNRAVHRTEPLLESPQSITG